jgi:histidine ammonia-lyase
MNEDMETAIEMIQTGELLTMAKHLAKTQNLAFETEWSEMFEF